MPSNLPAILGGVPLRPQGPPNWPGRDERVRAALESVFRDGSWGKYHGGNLERLESRLQELLGVPHVLTCASGTFAVEVALRAVGVAAGDEVVLAGYDYPGNFLSVHALSAKPVLVDVDAENWNFDPRTLEAALGPGVKAVVVSHLHGGLVPMREVMALCEAIGVPVVEDAAQCQGAAVEGRPAGTWGDVGVISFGGSKLLSAGRGGALFTRRSDVHQRGRLVLGRGTNLVAPMSELQAAVLLPQVEELEERNRRRLRAVRLVAEKIRGLPGLELFANRVEGDPGYYKVGLRYDAATFGVPRARLVQAVRMEGVALDEGFRALHVGRSGSRWRTPGALTQVERAHAGCVVLHHPVLLGEDRDVEQVAAAFWRIHEWREKIAG